MFEYSMTNLKKEKESFIINKSILNLEAIEFSEEKFLQKKQELNSPAIIQEPPIFDDIVKTGIAVHKYKIEIYKYNVEKLVLRNGSLFRKDLNKAGIHLCSKFKEYF